MSAAKMATKCSKDLPHAGFRHVYDCGLSDYNGFPASLTWSDNGCKDVMTDQTDIANKGTHASLIDVSCLYFID